METFSALIRGDLAPAGNKISLIKATEEFSYQLERYHSAWVDSGTSALALALADAKARAPHISKPQVIIPGYCCPDLVAAAVYAGVKPLAVDIAADDASYDLAALKGAISTNVIAVIAVNFLGIKERLADIRALLANTNIKLIEDNAQWLPASLQEHDFASDYVLFSFGRGKPLSLLGGGVLFSQEKIIVSKLIQPTVHSTINEVQLQAKILALNILLHPNLYCFLNRAPFLKLGETQYHPLAAITSIDNYRKILFSENLRMHEIRNKTLETTYDKLCERSSAQQLSSTITTRRMRLLRYPLLCVDYKRRDTLLFKLNAAGLGSSPLYQRSIEQIPGIDALIDVHGDIVNARHFARRLITLPIHEYVSNKRLRNIENILLNP